MSNVFAELVTVLIDNTNDCGNPCEKCLFLLKHPECPICEWDDEDEFCTRPNGLECSIETCKEENKTAYYKLKLTKEEK